MENNKKIAPAGPTPGQINKNYGGSHWDKNFFPLYLFIVFLYETGKSPTHNLKMDKRKPWNEALIKEDLIQYIRKDDLSVSEIDLKYKHSR